MRENRLIIASTVLAIIAIGVADLRARSTSTAANDSCTVPQQNLRQPEQTKEVWIGDVFSDEERLSYNGHVVEKRHKKVRYFYPLKIHSPPLFIDVSYAVIKRKGRVLAKFDDNIYFGMGNNVRFGLFSFFGGPTKQIVISQDIFRGGTQWIVSVSPRYRIIFNGPHWGVGREGDDLTIVDLDSDGVYEIKVLTCIFYGFSNLSPAATPLPTIIFKYSRKSRRYLPANFHFADYLLGKVEEQKQKIHPIGTPPDNMNHLGDVMTVVLDYVFAGREREAWTFYDHAYKLPDKNKIKRAIRAELKHSPVYRFIYRKT